MSNESRHKIGDTIVLNFYECGKISVGKISGVKYTDYGKVLYDVLLHPFSNEKENKGLSITLKDIDSYFIETEYESILEDSSKLNVVLSIKQKETYDFVKDYIERFRVPPTYSKIKETFNLSSCAAYARCKKFRHLMKRN